MTEGALRVALERNEIPYEIAKEKARSTGRRSTSTWRTRSDGSGRCGHDPARLADARALRPHVHGADNAEHPLYVVHRALYGSYERFIGILVEHFAGAFPVWLAPVQLRIIPVGEDHREAARALAEKLSDFRVEVDDSDETVGKRIRNAEVEKIPYTVVYGDRESEDALAVRERGGEQSTRSLDDLVKELAASLQPASRGAAVPHPQRRGDAKPGFKRGEEMSEAAACSGFVVEKEEQKSLVKSL